MSSLAFVFPGQGSQAVGMGRSLAEASAAAAAVFAEADAALGEPLSRLAWTGPAEELEDALLHPLRDDVLQPLRLVVDLVPAVAQDLDEEHLEEAVVADELEGDLATFAGQLLAAVLVVLDHPLRRQTGDHLAHAG